MTLKLSTNFAKKFPLKKYFFLFSFLTSILLASGVFFGSNLKSMIVNHWVAWADEPNFSQLTADGAWTWWQDPRAIRVSGASDKTYMGWITSTGDIIASSFDHGTQVQETYTLHDSLQVDDHANPTFLALADKRIMSFYSAHNGSKLFYRTTTNPEDISSWGPEQTFPDNTPGAKGYTYPTPLRLSGENDKIYLFWRGASWQPTFSTSTDNGQTWAPYKLLINNSPQRPYVKYFTNNTDTIYFTYTEGHPRDVFTSIYFGYYKNGAVHKADGTVISSIADLPIAPAEGDKVYDANIGGARAWGWDMAVDQNNRPVILYATFANDLNHEYWYARWDGTQWLNHKITDGGKYIDGPQEPHYSGGLTLDRNDPSIVFLSKEVNGIHEIQKWTTADGGATWSSEDITSGSSHKNFRPFSVWGHPGSGEMQVIWETGTYISYTNYNLSVNTYPAVSIAGPSPTPTPGPGQTTSLTPVADAYARGGNYANTNFGAADILVTKDEYNQSYTRESFLKFDVTAFSGPITSAVLRLHTNTVGSAANINNSIASVSNSSWTETGINWNNRPSSGANFATWAPSVGDWTEVDVTSQIQAAINGNKLASFKISSSNYVGSEGFVYYDSKEASNIAHRPQLEITQSGPAPTPTPSPSPTPSPTPNPSPMTYEVEADAVVRDGSYSNTNFGSDDIMGTKVSSSGYQRESYLRFNLTSYSGSVSNAVLRVYVTATGGVPGTTNAISVVTNPWSESSINWNNRPAVGNAFDTWQPVGGNWVEIDVTDQIESALSGDKLASFQLKATANFGSEGYAFYATKEYATTSLRPELVITP